MQDFKEYNRHCRRHIMVDLGLKFFHPKIRLPGTEDLDEILVLQIVASFVGDNFTNLPCGFLLRGSTLSYKTAPEHLYYDYELRYNAGTLTLTRPSGMSMATQGPLLTIHERFPQFPQLNPSVPFETIDKLLPLVPYMQCQMDLQTIKTCEAKRKDAHRLLKDLDTELQRLKKRTRLIQ